MKLLAAAKLVELSEEEAAELESVPPQDPGYEATQAVEPSADAYAAAPPPAEPPPVPMAVTEVVEGRAWDDIYAEAGLPASPYPAERLLRLIDGLRAMDPATRLTAVRAMDAADDSWTIEDPLLDAQRKIAALESYTQGLQAQVAADGEQAAAEIAALKATEDKAVAEIRKQIEGLERLLEREMHKTAENIAALEAGIAAEREAAGREARRIEAEIARLREIPNQFSSTTTSS